MRWNVQVHAPFPTCPDVLIGEIAARSAEFAPSAASGGAPVLIGCAAGEDESSVRLRARSELLERISNVLAGRTAEAGTEVIGSFAQLGPRHALDPAGWPVGEPGLRTARMLWVAGRSLVTGQEMLVPASAAFLHHRPPAGCTSAFRTGSTGVAAHDTLDAAARHALLEVAERDLAYRSWYADGPTLAAVVPVPDRLLHRLGLRAEVLLLPGPGVRCVVVCLHGGDGRAQSFGLRCTAGTAVDAVLPAVYEALMVRSRMHIAVARAAWERVRNRDPRLPHDVAERAALAYHAAEGLAYWKSKAAAPIVPEPRSRPVSDGELARAVADHTGQDVVAVETTIPRVRDEGLRVMRVVAPGAHQLPAAEPANSGCPPHPIS